MTWATFTIAVAFLCGTAAAAQPAITFESPCSCRGAHGKARLALKNDPAIRLGIQTRFRPLRLATSTVGRDQTYS